MVANAAERSGKRSTDPQHRQISKREVREAGRDIGTLDVKVLVA